MRVYLDNCCYNRPYDGQEAVSVQLETQAKLSIQDMIRNDDVELASSFVLWYELSQNPFEMRKKAIERFLLDNVLVYIEPDAEGAIKRKAEEIMRTGVKAKDAYHVACAIAAQCDSFLTTDRRLLKYQPDELIVENPIDFIRRMEEGSDDE